jgi:hypothetical protein
MRKSTARIQVLLCLILIAGLVSSCSKIPVPLTVVNSVTGEEKKAGVEEHQKLVSYADESGSIPLERLFHSLGYQAIDEISFVNADGSKTSASWKEIASSTEWLMDGGILLNQESLHPDKLTIEPDQRADPIEFSILDLAPTILSALSLPSLPGLRNPTLFSQKAGHVVFIFLDAFGYLAEQKAQQEGLIPNLLEMSKPMKGLSVYPPITSVVTAAMITGVEPETSGVDQSGKRSTKTATIFDQLQSGQKRFSVIEGNSLYLANLKVEDLILSTDDNQSGTNDDEVFQNAQNKIRQGTDDFVWVHFHGIDDAGHSHGPWSPEYIQRVQAIDGYIKQLVDASPSNTLFLITADHGMHAGNEGQRTGEHGNLIAEDMLIPFFVYLKP